MSELSNPVSPTAGDPSPEASAASASLPIVMGQAVQIPKPKEWQVFQRNCVPLFAGELRDPTITEFGRQGQDQLGIDLLGRRDGKFEHLVGVQCRHKKDPPSETEMMANCRAALGIDRNLKEIIFAFTNDDDKNVTLDAIKVERQLRTEGYGVQVVAWGWLTLQNKIPYHEKAHAVFHPSFFSSSALVSTEAGGDVDRILMELVHARASEKRAERSKPVLQSVSEGDDRSAEDPVLHAHIDMLRDLFRKKRLTGIALEGLLELLDKEDLSGRPWARFRVETNLASIDLEMGRELEAATRFEAAYEMRPEDSLAVANLALAKLIRREYPEAMELARRALAMTPPKEHAVGYLLQAAGRSGWQGDPITLIPGDLAATPGADIGLAEFYRRREELGWQRLVIDICDRHPDAEEFKRLRATAVLASAVEDENFLAGGTGTITSSDLQAAASDMKSFAERMLDIDFADERDLAAFLNNAGVLLRLAGRHADCAALLSRGLQRLPNDVALKRLRALSLAVLGERKEAAALLVGTDDPESRFLGAEILSEDNPQAGLEVALSVSVPDGDRRLSRIKAGLVGELALATRSKERIVDAIGIFRQDPQHAVFADVLESRAAALLGIDKEESRLKLKEAAAKVPENLALLERASLCEQLLEVGLPDEASRLLDGRVDLSRRNPVAVLYLRSLASSRRDEALSNVLSQSCDDIRDAPSVRWLVAAHAWNAGDIKQAYQEIEKLLLQRPNNGEAHLLRLEIFIRQDQTADVVAALEQPMEDLKWVNPKDQFRLATLLAHFGHSERAMRLSYRLFLEHRDLPRAWMTLSGLLIVDGQRASSDAKWHRTVAEPDTAIDLLFEDGAKEFFVVEPDASLRKLDSDSLEPEHQKVKAVWGLSTHDGFELPDGRKGTIAQIRHKYVARMHWIAENYHRRFPTVFGIKQVRFDPKTPGGMDEVIADLKDQAEWIEQELDEYERSIWPIGILAKRTGVDVIDAAAGLAQQDRLLKVAAGSIAEREEAAKAIDDNKGNGCVLDLLALWTAWKLGALDVFVAVAGHVHVPQSVIDRLRLRHEKLEGSAGSGHRVAQLVEGRVAMQSVPAGVIQGALKDLDKLTDWVSRNATACPVVASDDLVPQLREMIGAGKADLFDGLIVAHTRKLLLISDDLPTRQLGIQIGAFCSWSHQVISTAGLQGIIDDDTYVRWTAHLLDARHSYIGVTPAALVRALMIDGQAKGEPAYNFRSLARAIGGTNADIVSHAQAVIGFLEQASRAKGLEALWKAGAGLLLRQLIRGHDAEAITVLGDILIAVSANSAAQSYVVDWLSGHFLLQPVSSYIDKTYGRRT